MRIGTLTHMHNYNYGGVLQSASLRRVLSAMGHDVSVIDFPQSENLRRLRRYASVLGRPIGRALVDRLRAHRYGRDVNERFDSFRRNALCLSPPCDTTEELSELARTYDAVIVGSDQVWSAAMGIPEYYLSFDYSGRRLSYAACFGQPRSPASRWPRVREWLDRFDRISVRNEMSRRLVHELCGRESEVVADPVMLSDFDDLTELAGVPYERYILLYGLSAARVQSVSGVLASARRRLGLPLVGIRSSGLQPWLPDCVDYVVHNPGVGQWLGLFRRAEYIATDSFHGTLFAIKGKKQFFSFVEPDDGRVSYVVDRYGAHAGVPSDPNTAFAKEIDYVGVQPLVGEHVEQSLSFLRAATGGHGPRSQVPHEGVTPCSSTSRVA